MVTPLARVAVGVVITDAAVKARDKVKVMAEDTVTAMVVVRAKAMDMATRASAARVAGARVAMAIKVKVVRVAMVAMAISNAAITRDQEISPVLLQIWLLPLYWASMYRAKNH